MQSVELHLHTTHSLLDGLNDSSEYFARAGELGMSHLAITDHGVLSGHREHQRAAKEAGIQPILGCEMYISATDRFDRRTKAKRTDGTQTYNHLVVLAQDEKGLKNLNRLSEIAWTEGFYSKPRIDMDVLEEYNEGLIVLSGCVNGLIARALENGLPAMAQQYAREFKRIFGDRFFIEIQGHNPVDINKGLLEVAKKYHIEPVVTSDCHYAKKEDLWLTDAMLILSTSPKINKGFDFSKAQKMGMMERLNYAYPDRTMSFQEYEIFLRDWKTHDAMLRAQGISDRAIVNTLEVAKMIGDYPYHEGLDLLPRPEQDANLVLRNMVEEGLKDRGLSEHHESVARANEELEIIEQMGFAPYFLIEADGVLWGREQGIRFGPGRGSGAGSMVNYVLRITGVNPLEHNLLFFRFINPERNDWPDIDTDVAINRRSEIKAYLTRKYKNVASISTFGRSGGKESLRDASRVFLVPLGEVNKALKGAEWPRNWWENWEKTEVGKEFSRKYPYVITLAKHMFGRLRKQGMHAGGLIVSNAPISNYAPMQSAVDNSDASKTRIPLVALDMEEVAGIGFIKYDWLGLKALTIIDDTINYVRERHGIELDMESLPLDDPTIYKDLSEGYTRAVFQAEQAAYTTTIIKMGGVKNFGELAASNALVRPGAANSHAGAQFVARSKRIEPPNYYHKDMKWFTEETYGALIYQEQVMLTMTELAGMSMATADKVRKIIGKKRDVSEFEQYRAEFIEGASKKVSVAVAEQLWQDFEAHADYSFNKSHAVAYSMVTYWTAWLKHYYPLEFMTSVLRNEGDKDSVVDYLMEAKRLGLRVVLPDVNKSGVTFDIDSDERGEFIRFGLANVKFISDKGADAIMRHRPYNTYSDLLTANATKGSGINSRMIQALNAIGGATFLDNPRRGDERDNFYEYLNIPAFKNQDIPAKVKAQFRPLDEYSENEAFVCMGMVREIKIGDKWARVKFMDETGSAAAFTSDNTTIETGQMYVFLIANNRVVKFITTDELIAGEGGQFRQFLGATEFPDVPEGMLRVVSFRARNTAAGKKMADVVFCDEFKNLYPAMVWPNDFMKAFTKLREGTVVDVELSETKDGDAYFVSRIH